MLAIYSIAYHSFPKSGETFFISSTTFLKYLIIHTVVLARILLCVYLHTDSTVLSATLLKKEQTINSISIALSFLLSTTCTFCTCYSNSFFCGLVFFFWIVYPIIISIILFCNTFFLCITYNISLLEKECCIVVSTVK